MRKFMQLLVYIAVLVGLTSLCTLLFTEKPWQDGVADNAIALICASVLGIFLFYWLPKAREKWGLKDTPDSSRNDGNAVSERI